MTLFLRLLPLFICATAWGLVAWATLYGRDVWMRGF